MPDIMTIEDRRESYRLAKERLNGRYYLPSPDEIDREAAKIREENKEVGGDLL